MAFACVLDMKRNSKGRKGVWPPKSGLYGRIMQTKDINVYISSVVDKYSDMVYRAAYHAVCDRHYAEDITQEVFLKLMQTLPDFESEEHEKAWLLRVALNMCKSYNRKVYSHPTGELSETLPAEEKFGNGPVLEAVMELPEKYRTVVYLHYFEGYKIAEISEMTGQNHNTVSSLLLRARQKLRVLLKEEFDYEDK